MKKNTAIKILTEMQAWRRGDGELNRPPYSSEEYGLAIDFAIRYISSDKNKK
jgi:hypothetical protein